MDYVLQRERLETRLSALSAGVLAGQGIAALTEGSATNRGTRLGAILTALDRLETGEYSYCRICGADISADHLIAHPETPFCESCFG
ncbi:conjugal transfer protein TraR [Phaeobacter sp. B1627]|uniref:TraR/DksA family transcriptional regulator n=1 Tax=Phaeobacter sp. B1627 TaxID=2583809 RepID=UPI0011190844|nr:conjugal transfer protein TraR [Phaeobacter sp. B1627]TNJ48554.1 conjugal transfer protein TraR [Phaeobacter sp. B1627]